MSKGKLLAGLTAACVAGFLATGTASADTASIKAVGTWGNLTNYKKHEGPFWNDKIAELTGGSVIGEIKPQTELGLKGFEVMRLLKLGVFDYTHGVMGYVAAENAVFEGVDLSSVVQDIDTARKVTDAYFPILEKAFAEIYNAKLLQLYPFPSQTLWCSTPVGGIADLKGKKIRVYSTTLGDFVEGVGGTSVTIPFAEVVPALEKGLADCGITGTMSAYSAKWYQVATHAYTLRVGWGISFGAMNMDKWNSLSAEQQAAVEGAIKDLTEQMWAETATEDDVAISCITGGECSVGEKGGMKLVSPTADDLKLRDTVATDVVLARWAERCGADCAADWNATVGKIVGLTAKAK